MGSVKPLDPDMRQRLAATLSGDSKPGSLRHHLVEGLLGSQTGDDSGLVGYTPLGMVFAADAANRDRRMGGSGIGHTIEAAAGMIPGAGKLEGMAAKELRLLANKMLGEGAANADVRMVQQLAAKKEAADTAYEASRAPKLDRADGSQSWERTDPKSAVRDSMNDEVSARDAGRRNTVSAADLRATPDEIAASNRAQGVKPTLRQQLEQAANKTPGELGEESARADARAMQDQKRRAYDSDPAAAGIDSARQDNQLIRQQLEQAAGSKRNPNTAVRAKAVDDHMADIEERAYQDKGIPDHELRNGVQLENAGPIDAHEQAAHDYLNKLGAGGEDQFMFDIDKDGGTRQDAVDHLVGTYSHDELKNMTNGMPALTDAEYAAGGTSPKSSVRAQLEQAANPEDLSKMNFSGAKGSASNDMKKANDILKQHGYRIKGDREWGEYIVTGPGGEVTRTDDLNDAFHTALADKKFQAERSVSRGDKGPDTSPGRIPDEPVYTGQGPVEKGPNGKQMDLSPEEVSNGDPQKLNFIKNAMDDEGGNVPEEVADVLVQSLMKNPQKYKEVAKRFGSEAMEYPYDELYNSLSIPEMLSMHYDLDPKTLSKAYTMPAARPKGRPTQ